MKLLIITIFFFSCHTSENNNTAEDDINRAIKNGDTVLAKKLAQQELNRLRSSVKDSTFAVMLDAGLQIQSLEFALQKADSSQKIADDIIVNHPDGQRLYDLMMKAYKLAIENTKRESDVLLYTKELTAGRQEWLEANFAGKTNFAAKKSLLRLQKDIAIISAIVIQEDTDQVRKQTEDSYNELIK